MVFQKLMLCCTNNAKFKSKIGTYVPKISMIKVLVGICYRVCLSGFV